MKKYIGCPVASSMGRYILPIGWPFSKSTLVLPNALAMSFWRLFRVLRFISVP
jgi:hypothetical protein